MDEDQTQNQVPNVPADGQPVVGGDAPVTPPVVDPAAPVGQVPPAVGGEDPVAPPAPQEPDGDDAPAM